MFFILQRVFQKAFKTFFIVLQLFQQFSIFLKEFY